jgi:dienelactone hydrolase
MRNIVLVACSLMAFVTTRTTAAFAQSCKETNPPRSSVGGKPQACVKAKCPGPADDASHYDGGSIVYFPPAPLDQGPCLPANNPNVFSNGCADARATCSTITHHCVVQYQGLMYRPTSAPAKAPAVLLVPGSTGCTTIDGQCVRQPEHFCGLKNGLLAKGYVVFEVLPRGYGTDATHHSTGWYVDDAVAQQAARQFACTTTGIRGSCSTNDLELEGKQDVADAYQYLSQRSFVNPDAIGVLGHSLGGIRALAFNRSSHGQKATIIVAAAAESWCAGNIADTSLQAETLQSVDLAKSAMYFIDTVNDEDIDASQHLSHEAAKNNFQYQSTIFPPAALPGSSPPPLAGNEAHVCFISNQTYVDMYVPPVLDFLRRYGVR